MKNKGFTLIELLGVIIILGVLTVITFPVILNQIRNAKKGISESTKTLIIDAAKDYYEDNTNNYDRINGMTYCIDIQTLVDNNYLNKKLKDENLNDINIQKKIKMVYHNTKFDYEITDTCQNNVLTRNNIEVPIVTEGKGLYKSQTDIDRFIYRGGDEENNEVKNFIELNEGTDETPSYVKYRIISFESDGTIKVVRNEKLDVIIAWDERDENDTTTGPRHNLNNTYCNFNHSDGKYYGCGVWGNTSNTYYNGTTLNDLNRDFYYEYFETNSSTKLSFNSDYVGTVSIDSTLNTYLNSQWLTNTELLDYITTHSFNVGGLYYFDEYNAGDKGLLKEKQEEKIYTWKGKIGLINITEYVESSTNGTCTSVWSNHYYNPSNQPYKTSKEWPCKYENFNYKNYSQWSITPSTYYRSNAWVMRDSGGFDYYRTRNNNIGIRPAFYLKSSITLTGEGSETNPYRIAGES